MMKRILLSLAMLLLAAVDAAAGTCTTAVTWLSNSPTTSIFFADTISSSNLISCMTLTGPAGAALFPDAAALSSDAVANPTTTSSAALLYGFNGTNWDRLRDDTNKYLYTDLGAVGGSATATAATGVQKVGIVGNTGATVDAASGTAPTNFMAVANGYCGFGTALNKPFSNAGSANNLLLVTGTGGQKVHICAIAIWPVPTAVNVAVVEGTTVSTPCDTGTAGLMTGATAGTGMILAQGGGATYGNGSGVLATEATNADNVCLLFSAAVQVSGVITYATY